MGILQKKRRTTGKKALAYRAKGGQNTDTAFLALRLRVVLNLLKQIIRRFCTNFRFLSRRCPGDVPDTSQKIPRRPTSVACVRFLKIRGFVFFPPFSSICFCVLCFFVGVFSVSALQRLSIFLQNSICLVCYPICSNFACFTVCFTAVLRCFACCFFQCFLGGIGESKHVA